jgi:hypothetical protein
VLALITEGRTDRQIAGPLFISPTVDLRCRDSVAPWSPAWCALQELLVRMVAFWE